MKSILKINQINMHQLQNDNDAVIGIFGSEGSSKSNLMLHLKEDYCNKMNLELNIQDIGLDLEGFKNALIRNKMIRYGNPVFDEAQDGLYSREAMKGGLNILLNKTYMAIRGMNLYTILCMPDFFDLDPYFRKKRLRGAFITYKRGHCVFYSQAQLRLASVQGNFKGIKPLVRDTFPKYKGSLKDQYDKLKLERMANQIDKLDGTDGFGLISNKELIVELIKRQVPVPTICTIIKNEDGNPVHNSYIYRIRKNMGLGASNR